MNAVESNTVSYAQADPLAATAAQSGDRIEWIRLSLTYLPLATHCASRRSWSRATPSK